MESVSFIQPGALHGLAMKVIPGFIAYASRSRGRIYARSWAMLKSDRSRSVFPAGWSS